MNSVIIYIIISLLTIIILTVLYLTKCNKSKDGFCISNGIAGKRCNDPRNFQRDYNNGWTEFSDLTKEPPVWKEEIPETKFKSYPKYDNNSRC